MKYPSIEKYMADHNLSLREFARQCDMPSSTMCRLLKGDTEPSKSTIDKIPSVTGLSYEECFLEKKMKFKIEPDESGYFLYAKINDEWKLICFRLTFIGTKFAAWRYSRHYKKGGDFEL